MTDRELADEIEQRLAEGMLTFTFNFPTWRKIIAALRHSSDMVLVPRDIGELAQDMVATMNRQPGYNLAITHGRILKIAQEICRLYDLSKLSAAEAEGRPR